MQIMDSKAEYKCSICDSSFAQKGNLKKHIESIHKGKKHLCNS